MKIKQKQNENDTIAAYNINLMPSKMYECNSNKIHCQQHFESANV